MSKKKENKATEGAEAPKSAENQAAESPANTPANNDAEVAKLLKEREEQDKLIQELQGRLENSELANKNTLPVLDHGKEKYRQTIPKFRISGKVYGSEDLKKNATISVTKQNKDGNPETKEVKIVDYLVGVNSPILRNVKEDK